MKITGSVHDYISAQKHLFDDLLILPEANLPDKSFFQDTLIITSENCSRIVEHLYPSIGQKVFKLKEQVNKEGNIVTVLSEPEINRALRFIFTDKPKNLFVTLLNSYFNPIHETTITNVAAVAGYRTITTAISEQNL